MVDILAPGNQVPVAFANWEGANPDWSPDNGTSLATPHVAAAVAGMNHFSDLSNLPAYSKDPQVTRAIIVNSANKNVSDSGNNLWRTTEAFNTETIPLDNELGAGLLDAKRAIQQLGAGEQNPGNVPAVGWDWQLITQTGEAGRLKYSLNQKLKPGTELTLSLAWNRYLTINDNIALNPNDRSFQPFGEDLNGNAALNLALNEIADVKDYNRDGDTNDIVSEDLDGDGVLDGADTFNFETLDNLDLFLYRAGDVNPLKKSISSVDSIEHILFDVTVEDFYRIEVELKASVSSSAIYGLAWSGTAIPEPATLGLLLLGLAAVVPRRRRLHCLLVRTDHPGKKRDQNGSIENRFLIAQRTFRQYSYGMHGNDEQACGLIEKRGSTSDPFHPRALMRPIIVETLLLCLFTADRSALGLDQTEASQRYRPRRSACPSDGQKHQGWRRRGERRKAQGYRHHQVSFRRTVGKGLRPQRRAASAERSATGQHGRQ